MAEPQPERESDTPRQLLESGDDVDEILDEIDEALEENAEEFVRSYVQRGGNGGGEVTAFVQAWMEAVGPQRSTDVLELLACLQNREASSWAYDLIALRYGSRTASYWREIAHELLTSISTVAYEHLLALSGALHPSEFAGLMRLKHECALRDNERRHRFLEAKQSLELAIAADPDGATLLSDEYKHLQAAEPEDLINADSDAYQLLNLQAAIKSTLAPMGQEYSQRIGGDEDQTLPTATPSAQPDQHGKRPVEVAAIRPQATGATLEEATVELFRQLFLISSDDIPPIMSKLRRQAAGYQFGHDISFTAPAVGTEAATCHVECKNYRERIRPADIADKLIQQQSAAKRAPIDHWILISPHSDVSNDLAEMLREWEDESYWDFGVQVWSPETGIRELFAVAPELYRAIYQSDPPSIDEPAVLRSFANRVTPRERIHSGLSAYLKNGWRMCFTSEDADHFESLLGDHVELGTIDVAGRQTGRSLARTIASWLESDTPSTMLLLGEFGDGKSFFTYSLCRRFATEFLKNPRTARFPVRLALRDLRQAGSTDELINRWLQSIGVPRVDWLRVAAEHPTLIVLDGFDEMTTELDPPTISGNLRLLADTVESIAGTGTSKNRGRKILVTSRGRFFDQPREEAALRERLRDPLIVRIRPLSRTEVLAHLSRYAHEVGVEDKLAKIRILYDPIGLAAKPLFLQMIKDTLQELPSDDFGAITLYEKYIDKSLRRKSALLLGDDEYELSRHALAGMRVILEKAAVALHNSSTDQVNLRDIESADNDLANLLWRMASERTSSARNGPSSNRADDARMRVSVRSLLMPMRSGHDDEWPVNFFHRSMAEFFLARAVVGALVEDDVTTIRDALGSRALSKETVEFIGDQLANSDALNSINNRLESLVHGATRRLETDMALGGNAMTLLFRLGGLTSRIWTDLRLDNVRLTGATLRGFDFSGSSLRFANFDNADLRKANLTGADLTGLRVEQTTHVEAICVDPDAHEIFAAYSDGSIRAWRPTGTGGWVPQTVFEGLEGRVSRLVAVTRTMVVALTRSEAWIFARTEPRWAISTRTPVSPYLVDFSSPEIGIASSLQVWGEAEYCEVNLGSGERVERPDEIEYDLALRTIASDILATREEFGGTIVHRRWAISKYASFSSNYHALWNIAMGYRYDIEESNPTAFDVADSAPNAPILFVGTMDGRLLRGSIENGSERITVEQVGSAAHDGPVTAVHAVSDNYAVTGGRDRCLRVWRINDGQVAVQPLYLTLRCRGAVLRNVEGRTERELLRRLAREDVYIK